jgi:hypothetical protein
VSSRHRKIKKRERVSIQQRGRMCVGSFARANTRHPQTEEAERQKRKRSQGAYLVVMGRLYCKNMTAMKKGPRRCMYSIKEMSDIRLKNKG